MVFETIMFAFVFILILSYISVVRDVFKKEENDTEQLFRDRMIFTHDENE